MLWIVQQAKLNRILSLLLFSLWIALFHFLALVYVFVLVCFCFTLVLFDLVFTKQHPLSDNGIEFYQFYLVWGIPYVLAGRIKESCARATQQLDGNRLGFSLGH